MQIRFVFMQWSCFTYPTFEIYKLNLKPPFGTRKWENGNELGF
jgi:hypothetical protein